ncbi:calcineurin-like phosphoesterase family protein [Bradyrhizobium sp. AZCC 1678]|uniref:metallophosphoesterase n=1 Tax=Bradyrhizobium sp. AZCC 1678 TaxID=3117030 RepID=UPI002FEE8284
MATFLIADPHYFHAGIIKLCQRPFADVREMNSVLKMSWNSVVKNDDDVMVLGDFAHRAGDANELRALFDSLQGRKHLVIGNHDDDQTLKLPWASPPRDVAYLSIDSQRVVLCHYAWRTWPGIRKGALMLYGHNHGRLPGNRQSADIGVDVLGFAPVRLNQIKQYLAALPPLVDPEGDPDPNGGVTP